MYANMIVIVNLWPLYARLWALVCQIMGPCMPDYGPLCARLWALVCQIMGPCVPDYGQCMPDEIKHSKYQYQTTCIQH